MKRLLKYVMRATLAAAFAVLGISPAAAQSAVQAEGRVRSVPPRPGISPQAHIWCSTAP